MCARVYASRIHARTHTNPHAQATRTCPAEWRRSHRRSTPTTLPNTFSPWAPRVSLSLSLRFALSPFPPSLSSLRSRLCLSVYVCVSRIVCAVCACVSSYLICKSSMHMQSRARQSPPTHAHTGQFLIDDEDYAVRGALVLRQGALSWPAPAPPPSPASAAPAAPAKKEPPTPKEIAAAAAAATRRQVRVRRRCRACARRRPCVRLCGWVCLTRATKP